MRKIRRKEKLYHKESKKSKKLAALVVAAILFLFALGALVLYLKFLNLQRFVYVEKLNDGSAAVRLIDSKQDKIYEVLIPADTELELSYSLGKYKVANAWILAQKEGYQGTLVSKTITKNYGIPVYLWKDGKASNLSSLQSLKVSLLNKGMVRMSIQSFTADTKSLPYYVLLNFVDPYMAEHNTKLEIEDQSGSYSVTNMLSPVVEAMGAKIVNYSKSDSQNNDYHCYVSGKDKYAVNLFKNVFSCQETTAVEDVDVKLKIGKSFVEKF